MELCLSQLQDKLYKAFLRLVPECGRYLWRDHKLCMWLLNAPTRFEKALYELGGLTPGEEPQLDGEPHGIGLFKANEWVASQASCNRDINISMK